MKKIPSLFARDSEGNLTTDYHPLASWVVAGEGVATRKWDGTACRILGGALWARYDAKRGKTPPEGFEPCQPEPDPVTGHWPGWIRALGPEHKYIREAYENSSVGLLVPLEDGTYEACGPKINANPERMDSHQLIRHGVYFLIDAPRTRGALVQYFLDHPLEGIVWWRTSDLDCDKVKITADALGIAWPR